MCAFQLQFFLSVHIHCTAKGGAFFEADEFLKIMAPTVADDIDKVQMLTAIYIYLHFV